MTAPIIKSGRFHAGTDLQCGENVIIDVADEVVVGDRCVLSDNAYFGGRRVALGNDCFLYSHWGKRLEIGLGRRDEEDAVLTVGSSCTLHDNRIDLARRVTLRDDVGLSPEVAIYTHGYWQSCLKGYPCRFAPVAIMDGVIIGFRSVLLPGAFVVANSVIGAGSVVSGALESNGVYAGNPARLIRPIEMPPLDVREARLHGILNEYRRSCVYRGLTVSVKAAYPFVTVNGLRCDVEAATAQGEEDAATDDFRLFVFKRGIRLYTRRPFRSAGRQA